MSRKNILEKLFVIVVCIVCLLIHVQTAHVAARVVAFCIRNWTRINSTRDNGCSVSIITHILKQLLKGNLRRIELVGGFSEVGKRHAFFFTSAFIRSFANNQEVRRFLQTANLLAFVLITVNNAAVSF